jgi:hypothetical protein
MEEPAEARQLYPLGLHLHVLLWQMVLAILLPRRFLR